jgi:hypothetical protein
MSSIRPDFEILAERADDYGTLWATRILGRIAEAPNLPRDWPGTIDEARRMVDTFAAQTAYADRERLAAIVQHSAQGMWTDSIRAGDTAL